MSLALRFVDNDMRIREEFVSFLDCKWGLKGEQLAKTTFDALSCLGISINDCRGQGYGAGAFAGHINGLSAHLLRLNEKALFTPCYSHRLILAICDSINITEVKTMFKRVKSLRDFFPFLKHVNYLLRTTLTCLSQLEGNRSCLMFAEPKGLNGSSDWILFSFFLFQF